MSYIGHNRKDCLGRREAASYRRPDYSWCTQLQYASADLIARHPELGFTKPGWPHEKLPRARKWTPVPESYFTHPNWPDLGGEQISVRPGPAAQAD